MFKRRRTTDAEFGTYIGPDAIAKGDISGKSNIRIQGTVKGNIKLKKGTIWVDKSGVVKGTISATVIAVHGKVGGDVIAKKKLEVGAEGIIRGDIRCRQVFISSQSKVRVDEDEGITTIFQEKREEDTVPMFDEESNTKPKVYEKKS